MVCSDLHLRLKQARERRGLTLTAIARQQGVREHNLALIERNAFEDLPTGLYGRAAVRAYASAVGLDPDDAVADVTDRLRSPEDPIDGLARVRGIDRPRARRAVEVAPGVARPVRLPLPWRTPAAAVIDSTLLIAIDAGVLALTALVAGVRPGEVLQAAFPSLLVVFAIIAGIYFVILGGVRRATIGARLVQAEPAAVFDGPGVQAAMQRGLRYALDEGASLFGWLTRSVVR